MRSIKAFLIVVLTFSLLLTAACGIELGNADITEKGTDTTTLSTPESDHTTALGETVVWTGTTAPVDTTSMTDITTSDDSPVETTTSTEPPSTTTNTTTKSTTITTTTKATTTITNPTTPSTTTTKATTATTKSTTTTKKTTNTTTTKVTTKTKSTTATALSIKTQPQSISRLELYTLGTITVVVTGGRAPYTYQWQSESQGFWSDLKDNNVFSSSGTKTLELFVDGSSSSFSVYHEKLRCKITDSDGEYVISNEVEVGAPLLITRQPVSQSIAIGKTAHISVNVMGGKPPYTYRWQIQKGGGTFFDITDGGEYAGSKTSTLSLRPGTTNSWIYFDNFRCVIKDAEGTEIITAEFRISK